MTNEIIHSKNSIDSYSNQQRIVLSHLLLFCVGGFWETVVAEYEAAEPPSGFQGETIKTLGFGCFLHFICVPNLSHGS